MAEIYTLRIELIDGRFANSEWARVIEVSPEIDFVDLHYIIQDAIKFDNDHMHEFHLGTSPYNRKVVFGEPDGWSDYEYRSVDTKLKEIYPLGKLKLFYHFDFGDDWLFQIKKERKVKQTEPRKKYPRIIEKIGRNPPQYGRGWY